MQKRRSSALTRSDEMRRYVYILKKKQLVLDLICSGTDDNLCGTVCDFEGVGGGFLGFFWGEMKTCRPGPLKPPKNAFMSGKQRASLSVSGTRGCSAPHVWIIGVGTSQVLRNPAPRTSQQDLGVGGGAVYVTFVYSPSCGVWPNSPPQGGQCQDPRRESAVAANRLV